MIAPLRLYGKQILLYPNIYNVKTVVKRQIDVKQKRREGSRGLEKVRIIL
jgi:hypothetical protein